ncbi:MAG: penicillin-binding protein 2 [Candidatus Pacebacteria bacterium]|jgi:cell division protein FtsI/penicillin-binding protein 2|nr:penicillin-binding protein 2 [Candidatus Paceibacterota bacterium]MBT4652086.1 penicillin-binding protein 2 [Candidatus Paceibacterota bacterium]MBT6756108.1 penicillin-binding protein 2 [Candidatus Paceibacterota bacterium]MBT6921701.1 penicillin-binding protein 2 [Candidatus Paceibacterota bacterium]
MTSSSLRPKLLLLTFLIAFSGVIARLFYWQIIQGYSLKKIVENQGTKERVFLGKRGQIFTRNNHLLVGNTDMYHLMVDKSLLEESNENLAKKLSPFLAEKDVKNSTESADLEELKILTEENKYYLEKRLSLDSTWVRLSSRIGRDLKKEIEDFNNPALYFEKYDVRYYPEASMAAHLTGFVGKDEQGQDTGYFGLEGSLNKELEGKLQKKHFFTDALGNLLGGENNLETQSLNGRDIVLTIQRDIQFLLESELKNGMERYGALSGEIIVLDPETGDLLGLAAFPQYDPEKYYTFPSELYKNPSLANTYEPGSTFKTLTVAAGIDAEVITPETECPNCDGPKTIGKYTVKTWNNEYNPNITMKEALAKSDNIAMIFIAETLGVDKFTEYLKKFGIGEEIKIDLQDDTSTPFPKKWGPIELATTSFGQGISTNSLQMVRAVSAIANQGIMMRPKILKEVQDYQSNKTIEIKPREERKVISPETAQTMTELMIHSAKHGEAQWIFKDSHTVAGKTGTSQIPIKGGYKENATIASFIGFAPAEKPRFVMLVKLNEPQSSPWAAETAAPLWYRVAGKLFLLMNIPPDTIASPTP